MLYVSHVYVFEQMFGLLLVSVDAEREAGLDSWIS